MWLSKVPLLFSALCQRYKLHQRLLNLYQAEDNLPCAESVAKDLKSSLQLSKLRGKAANDVIQSCDQVLRRLRQRSRAKSFLNPSYAPNEGRELPHLPEIIRGHGTIAGASDALAMTVSSDKGRHSVARQDISCGEIILIDEPVAVTLTPEAFRTHCYECLKEVIAAYPCWRCSGCVFCSDDCRRIAERRFLMRNDLKKKRNFNASLVITLFLNSRSLWPFVMRNFCA